MFPLLLTNSLIGIVIDGTIIPTVLSTKLRLGQAPALFPKNAKKHLLASLSLSLSP